LDQVYNITVWNLVPLVVLVILSVRKAPPAMALMGAAILAGAMAPFTQPNVVRTFADAPGASLAEAGLRAAWRAIARGFSIESGSADIHRALQPWRHRP